MLRLSGGGALLVTLALGQAFLPAPTHFDFFFPFETDKEDPLLSRTLGRD